MSGNLSNVPKGGGRPARNVIGFNSGLNFSPVKVAQVAESYWRVYTRTWASVQAIPSVLLLFDLSFWQKRRFLLTPPKLVKIFELALFVKDAMVFCDESNLASAWSQKIGCLIRGSCREMDSRSGPHDSWMPIAPVLPIGIAE